MKKLEMQFNFLKEQLDIIQSKIQSLKDIQQH